jgi:ankyrin repeat protein
MNLFKNLFFASNSKNKYAEEEIKLELSNALLHCSKSKVQNIIAAHEININSCFVNSNSILFEAVNCLSEYQGTNQQLELVKYLIENKADVNWKNSEGYSVLHISLSYHKLSKISLLLISNTNTNINLCTVKNGNNPIFIAVREYRLT